MAFTLIGLLIALMLLTFAASCSRPVVTMGQNVPALPDIPTALSDGERQKIAEQYIQTVATYGWDTPVIEWTRAVSQFTRGSNAVFPLTGPAYARCLNDLCQYRVQDIRRVPETDMSFVVTSLFMTTTTAESFESVWDITVNTEGVVTDATSAGEG
jgi:hypothetical protein